MCLETGVDGQKKDMFQLMAIGSAIFCLKIQPKKSQIRNKYILQLRLTDDTTSL